MRKLSGLALTVFLGVVLGNGAARAQSPNILDAIDVIDPGISVSLVRQGPTPSSTDCASLIPPIECGSDPNVPTITGLNMDAAGNWYRLTRDNYAFGLSHYGRFLQRIDRSLNTTDVARVYSVIGGTQYHFDFFTDAVNGRILARVVASSATGSTSGFVEISGLPTVFELMLTYVPPSSLSILTPTLPDGFGSADALQLWAGDTRTIPDWSKAAPVACPAASGPAPGARVVVADTLPDPAEGRATYYLVAAAKGTERRLGRQYVAGVFSARNPAALPACP